MSLAIYDVGTRLTETPYLSVVTVVAWRSRLKRRQAVGAKAIELRAARCGGLAAAHAAGNRSPRHQNRVTHLPSPRTAGSSPRYSGLAKSAPEAVEEHSPRRCPAPFLGRSDTCPPTGSWRSRGWPFRYLQLRLCFTGKMLTGSGLSRAIRWVETDELHPQAERPPLGLRWIPGRALSTGMSSATA